MEDVTVGKPTSNAVQRDSDRWIPYVAPGSVYAGSGVPDSMEAVAKEQVYLCEIMAPCGDFLYAIPTRSPTHPKCTTNFIHDLDTETQASQRLPCNP